jgi:hypothetical protein
VIPIRAWNVASRRAGPEDFCFLDEFHGLFYGLRIFAAKLCNFAQRGANVTVADYLASATARKPVKTSAKTLSWFTNQLL